MNKDIPDYKLCKKLKELGWKQEGLFFYWWNEWVDTKEPDICYTPHPYNDAIHPAPIKYEVIAPTIWEMMDVLPEWFNIEKKDWEYFLHYSKYSITVHLDTLANTLAKTLTILIECWHLDPKLLD